MSLFDDVAEMGNTTFPSPDAVLAADQQGGGHEGSGFTTMTPAGAFSPYAGGMVVDDHLGHQTFITPSHGANVYQGGIEIRDNQGHMDHLMPLPGGGYWHP